MTIPRLFVVSRSILRRAMSGRIEDAKSTTEPGNVVMAWCRRSRSVHWAMMRISSSMASTFAVPALKIACESARMILFIMFASSAV